MSRRVYLLGWGLALVALALAFTDRALSLRPGVTEVNAKRLRPGMMVRDAEAILGRRGLNAGTYASRAGVGSTTWLWSEAGTLVLVRADTTGRIERVAWATGGQAQPGPLARLRAWLGW